MCSSSLKGGTLEGVPSVTANRKGRFGLECIVPLQFISNRCATWFTVTTQSGLDVAG